MSRRESGLTELQEARLLGRAIKSRWEISDSEKAKVMTSLLEIAVNGNEESARIAASKAIITAEGQNQKDEIADALELRKQLLQLASQFGVVAALESGAGAPAIGGDREPVEANQQDE